MNTSRSLLLGMLATTLLSSPAWSAEKVGVIGAAGATVTVTGADQKARVAKTGDEIFLGDMVTTDGSGKAQIIFLDRSSITLKPGSDLTIDTFVYDPSTSSGELAMKSAKGAFRFIGGALSKKKPVKLNTPVGTIGIRGGIADASIDAGGKTDAFFLYGEEMSFTNQQGEQSSTRQFGTGLALASADATPQPVPATQVAAHFDGFRAAPGDAPLPGAPDAGSVERGLNLGTDASTPLPASPSAENGVLPGAAGTPPQGPNDGGTGGNGPNGGSQNAAGNGGNSGGPANTPQGTASSAAPGTPGARPPVGGANAPGTQLATRGTAPAIGGLPNGPLLEPVAPRIDTGVIATAAQTRVDGVINTAANTGVALTGGGQLSASSPLPVAGTLLPPPTTAPTGGTALPPPPAGTTGTDATLPPPPAVETTVTAAPAGAILPLGPTYTQFGRYVTRNGTGAYPNFNTTVSGRGGLLGNVSGAGHELHFNASFGTAFPDLTIDDLVAANAGSPNGVFDNRASVSIGGNTYESRSYQPQSGNWNYYMLRDTTTNDQTTLIFGQSLVAGSLLLSNAIADTRTYVNSASGGSSYDVSFFDFMPGMSQYQNNSNRDELGMLDYNFFEPSQSLSFYGVSPSQIPKAPLGMGVNWASNKFLTGFMHWNPASTAYTNIDNNTPQLLVAYGNVNSGGPQYLSGDAFAFRSVKNTTALSPSTTPDKISDTGKGVLSTGMNIYGSTGKGIESMVVDVVGNGRDVSTGNLSSTNGSNVIIVNAAGHGLATGDTVEMRSPSPFAGIPVGELNGLKTVTRIDANTYSFTTATAAASSLAGPTTYATRPRVEADSQLAVARTLDYVADSGQAIRDDLYKTQSLPNVRTLHGFAGGLVILDHKSGGGNLAMGFTNESPTQVSVTQTKSTGTVSASLNVNDTTNTRNITASFNGENAFLGHRLWGVNQTGASFTESGVPTSTSNVRGTLVAGTHIVDQATTPVCKQCQFVEWGVWAGQFDKGLNFPVSANMIPVVVGEVTDTAAVTGSPSAVYNGPAYGSFRYLNQIDNAKGDLTANADLVSKNITNVSMNFPSVFGNSVNINTGAISQTIDTATTGKAVFSAPATTSGLATGSAQIHGALFGPNGEEIGGNFRITSGVLAESAGVFLGKQ